jgi:hypothetical protein
MVRSRNLAWTLSFGHEKFKTRSQFIRRRCQELQRLTVTNCNCWPTTLSTRRLWLATWSQCAMLSNG